MKKKNRAEIHLSLWIYFSSARDVISYISFLFFSLNFDFIIFSFDKCANFYISNYIVKLPHCVVYVLLYSLNENFIQISNHIEDVKMIKDWRLEWVLVSLWLLRLESLIWMVSTYEIMKTLVTAVFFFSRLSSLAITNVLDHYSNTKTI